jgi:TRAP-type mannitol/chloroaromatic compound transport system substrate-binding protein
MLSEFEVKNAEYLEKIRTESKVTLKTFPPDVINRLREISQEVIEELAASDPMCRKIADALYAFKAKMNKWAELSEKEFYADF